MSGRTLRLFLSIGGFICVFLAIGCMCIAYSTSYWLVQDSTDYGTPSPVEDGQAVLPYTKFNRLGILDACVISPIIYYDSVQLKPSKIVYFQGCVRIFPEVDARLRNLQLWLQPAWYYNIQRLMTAAIGFQAVAVLVTVVTVVLMFMSLFGHSPIQPRRLVIPIAFISILMAIAAVVMCIAIASFARNSQDIDWLPNSGNSVDDTPTNSVSWSFFSAAASIGFAILASGCLGTASTCACVNTHQNPAIKYERSIDTKPVPPEVDPQLQQSNDSVFFDGVGVSLS